MAASQDQRLLLPDLMEEEVEADPLAVAVVEEAAEADPLAVVVEDMQAEDNINNSCRDFYSRQF